MYTLFPSTAGKLIVKNSLVTDVKYLMESVASDFSRQYDSDDIMFFVIDLFGDDCLKENYNVDLKDDGDLLKLAVLLLNVRVHIFDDPYLVAEQFNNEGLPLRIGFDDLGTFYPLGIGSWHGRDEFVFMPEVV